MTASVSPDIKSIFINDFNISLLAAFCLLAFYQNLAEAVAAYDQEGLYRNVLIPALNGFLTALAMLILNRWFGRLKFAALYYSKDKFKLLLTAFLAGAAAFYITFSVWATYLVTAAVIFCAAVKIRRFSRKLSALLSPHTLASRKDMGSFFNFFITLIISFAVINLAVNVLHQELGLGSAFNFGFGIDRIINALYFSVITITTVGYGDIIPLTAFSRVIVAFECVTCYFTLGIMIGIICRGLSFKK